MSCQGHQGDYFLPVSSSSEFVYSGGWLVACWHCQCVHIYVMYSWGMRAISWRYRLEFVPLSFLRELCAVCDSEFGVVTFGRTYLTF